MNESKFTIKDCDDVIRQCLQIGDVQTVDFEIIPRHKDNFIFKITGEYDSRKETLCFYAKSKSRPPQIDKILYEDFKNVLEDFNPKITPKFFCGKSELLFFEDLTCQKFQTNPNLFDLKHLHQVLKVLAEFHAAGFAYEEVSSKKLDEEYELESSNLDLKEAEDLLWSCVDNKEKVDDVERQLEERQLSSKFAKTLCHSNLTSANILFHYNNGVPDECKLVNFKSRLYAPPIYDVLQVIFFNTSEEFRQKNFEDLLFFYYDHFVEEIDKYHLDIEDTLSHEDFRMSSHHILPLIKLEAAILQNRRGDKNRKDKVMDELKEILSFPPVSREDCYVIVKNAIKSPDYELLSFHTSLKSVESSFKVTIKIHHFIEEKTINCFGKCLPNEEKVEENYFNKEIFFYKILFPQFQEFGIINIHCCLPSSYFQRAKDVIVFPDLSILKFCSLSTLNLPDFRLLAIIIKKLAKLHCCSLIFEEKMSEKLKTTYHLNHNYENHLKETLCPRNGIIFDQKLMDLVFHVVNIFPELKTENNEENLKKYFPKLLKSFYTSTTPSDRFRNVICHGDVTTKNILVEFDDDVPIDCRFINCNSIRYCPPAYDFLSAIYLTTNRETRIKNEEALKQIYCRELEKTISTYDYKTNKFFSYQEFLDSVEFSRPQMILQAVICNIFQVIASEKKSARFSEVCDWILSEDLDGVLTKMCGKLDVREKLKDNVLDLYDLCNSLLPNVIQ